MGCDLSRTAEGRRLAEDASRAANWKRWGPYLSERQWGTVREDYSADANSWNYFPFAHARSRAYRWGEDGLLGFTDRECRLCFSLALWNGRDPILKERLFGVAGPQGNHGEDVKELYYYLDSTPTHSYMKALYKYPQGRFPYERLLKQNAARTMKDPEFELLDTGLFDGDRYFDVAVEYAKAEPNDLLVRISATNRGPEAARLHVLPTLWFRNTWSWGCDYEGCWLKPIIKRHADGGLVADHVTLGKYRFQAAPGPDGQAPRWLLTENETNVERVFGQLNPSPFVKDAFHDHVVFGQANGVDSRANGTKAAAWYVLEIPPGETRSVALRLFDADDGPAGPFGPPFERVFEERLAEADEFYAARIPPDVPDEARRVVRQAYAGLLWTKQFYHYVVLDWLRGDPLQPPPPESRTRGLNHNWIHLFNRDVISMPDKWEFPWYAAWDLAFQMLPFAQVDAAFAKEQLVLFTREWYMHPNGQVPAFEYMLDAAEPPVHAWACWRIYKIAGPKGGRDRAFLQRVFHKLLLNFTWWVNRTDVKGDNVFSGGFLGLDNIGVFDRSKDLPVEGTLEQADATAWMAFYSSTMLAMALELSLEEPVYEDLASKFFEHFVAIAEAMNTLGGTGLWDEQDGFYYDQIRVGESLSPLRVRSYVGLLPLIAVEVMEGALIDRLPGFKKRMHWFLENRRDLKDQISYMETAETGEDQAILHRLLAIPSRERLRRVLRYVLDENEFLSPYGIRSLSKFHKDHPYVFDARGEQYRVEYVPGESNIPLFGGNSNWRGPVWFPINYLLIEALERYHHFYGDSFQVECPTGSGRMMNLGQVARQIALRLSRLFMPDTEGRRPCHGDVPLYAKDPHWKDLVLFYEHFHGDTGRGLGASHQTGWTALMTRLVEDLGRCGQGVSLSVHAESHATAHG